MARPQAVDKRAAKAVQAKRIPRLKKNAKEHESLNARRNESERDNAKRRFVLSVNSARSFP